MNIFLSIFLKTAAMLSTSPVIVFHSHLAPSTIHCIEYQSFIASGFSGIQVVVEEALASFRIAEYSPAEWWTNIRGDLFPFIFITWFMSVQTDLEMQTKSAFICNYSPIVTNVSFSFHVFDLNQQTITYCFLGVLTVPLQCIFHPCLVVSPWYSQPSYSKRNPSSNNSWKLWDWKKSVFSCFSLILNSQYIYWGSWLIWYSIPNLFSTLAIVAIGSQSIFYGSNLFLVFLLLFVFGLSVICFGFLLSSLVENPKVGSTFSFESCAWESVPNCLRSPWHGLALHHRQYRSLHLFSRSPAKGPSW